MTRPDTFLGLLAAAMEELGFKRDVPLEIITEGGAIIIRKTKPEISSNEQKS